jgi:uncharacterized protein YjbI with pentapeptide repeats
MVRLAHSAARVVLAFSVSLLVAATASAQVVGENVNMVSGTEWPGGDPFLQRQNEPTVAVSSVNPQHLMAGANDYRSVDVPDPAFGKLMGGDAWLGVFKSLDGGQTWKSVLLPGYPQDPHCQAKPANPAAADPSRRRHHKNCSHASDNTDPTPALCGLPAAADPVMRSGTDGMFYYLGLNFARDKSVSRLFVGRYLDLNNKENGDATKATDPIRYLDTQIVASSTDAAVNGGKPVFIDKPWMAVDVPRAGAQTCTVPDPDNKVTGTKQILAGAIYVGWAQFNPDESLSDVMITWSSDCGLTWVKPTKLNTSNSVLNQGVAIAIEPITGRVYVTWRRVPAPTQPGQTNAIMATRSEGRKRHFAAPRVIAKLIPFDLGNGDGQARTQTMPSMAISSDGASSWAHVVWAAREAANGLSKVWMTNAKVFPPPAGDQDADDPDDYEDDTRLTWTKPALAPVGTVGDDLNHVFTRGHQYMPAVTASQGKLVLFYYDSRFDHMRRYYKPYPLDAQGNWTPDLQGKFYQEELAPIGDREDAKNPTYPLIYGNVGLTPPADIYDGALQFTRHTVDVRVGMATPGLSPAFTSVLVSKFPFGLSGAESKWKYDAAGNASARTEDLKVPGFGPGNTADPAPAAAAAGLTVMTKEGEVKLLQQLQFNPSGFPMFKGHSTGFIGDYIDIQGQTFVPVRGGWAFNLAPSRAPVFHAVWTSNQDVKVPFDANGIAQWGNYTPVTLMLPGNRTAGGNILFDGGRADPNITNPNITNTPIAVCDPASTGSRDQNIYTARITDGLAVSTPQNSKFLNGQVPVGFVIAAANTTPWPMTVAFGTPVTDPATVPGTPGPKFSYSTSFSTPVLSVTADIAPFSSVHRTLFVIQDQSLNSAPTIMVKVTESTGCGGNGQPTCREGSLIFNPPVALSSLVAPDGATAPGAGEVYTATIGAPNITNPNITNPNITNPNITNPNITNPNITNPNITNPNITNPNITNPNITNPNITNPNITNPNITNPNITNPNITNPNITNPNITNPNITNPNITNPNITNPNITNPNITNPNITNTSLSDATYTFTNQGNTSSSYFVKLVGDGSALPSPLQMIVAKTYKTPTAVGCDLKEVPHDQIVVSVPDVSGSVVGAGNVVRTGVEMPNITNATLALAPGETATVTLRGNFAVAEMAKVVSAVTPAPVPAAVPPTNTTTYADWGTVTGTPFVKRATTTSLSQSGTTYTATVSPASGPTGTVSFIVGPSVRAVRPLASGTASLTLDASLPTGQTMVAFYSGDATWAASSSNAVVASDTRAASQTTLQRLPGADTAIIMVTSMQSYPLGSTPPPSPDFSGNVTVSVDSVPTATVALPSGGCPYLAPVLPICVIASNTCFVNAISCAQYQLPLGAPHTLGATYEGNFDLKPSTAAPLAFSLVPTSLAIRLPASATAGVPASVSVDMTIPLGTTPNPGGLIYFTADTVPLGTASFTGCANVGANRVCTFTGSLTLTAGVYGLEASYPYATDPYVRASAGPVSFTVSPAGPAATTTTVTWSSSPTNGSGLLGMIDFWVEVTGPAGSTVAPTGPLELHLGTNPVMNGSVGIGSTCITPTPGRACSMYWAGSTMSAGPHDVYAIYSPASGSPYASSASPHYSLNVATALPITLASSQNPSAGTTPVTFTASFLVPNDHAAPTGTMSFHDGSFYHLLLGTSPITCGPDMGYHYCAATWTGTAWTAPGTYGITAAYSGDPTYVGYSRGWATVQQIVQ